MSQDKFSRREVERAFRKFKDLVNDLMAAKFQTWPDGFTHLITHCERDPVMQVVTEPLRANKNVDAGAWYKDCMASVRGMIGSGRYQLPIDDDDRTALLYQFFLNLEREEVDLLQFCLSVYGTTNYQEMTATFNQELVAKFAREVAYRLDEIMEDIGNDKEVSREAMIVFHHHDHSMNIQGNIQGSNVAAGGASISGSPATYNNAELADALKALKPLLHEVVEGQKAVVEQALNVLIASAENDSIPVAQVAQAVDTVATSSPTMKERMRDIGGKLSLSLVSAGIVQGIKSYFGIH